MSPVSGRSSCIARSAVLSRVRREVADIIIKGAEDCGMKLQSSCTSSSFLCMSCFRGVAG